LFIYKRKYALDIIEETRMINVKLVDTPMDLIVKLELDQGELYSELERYKTLVDKLNSLV